MPDHTSNRDTGSWGRRLAAVALGLAALVALAAAPGGCVKAPVMGATVRCAKATGGIDCQVRHAKGVVASNVCWDVTLVCQDGLKVSGNGCKVVRAGQVLRQVIAAEELPDFERCTSVKRVEIQNVRLLESIE